MCRGRVQRNATVRSLLARERARLRKHFEANLPAQERTNATSIREAPSSYSTLSSPPPSQHLITAIAGLRDPYRSVLTLALLEHYTCAEIANRLNRPIGTIKGQLHRGRALLLPLMQQQHTDAIAPAVSPTPPSSQQTLAQQALHLREQHHHISASIATTLHISPGYARVLVHRAKKNARRHQHHALHDHDGATCLSHTSRTPSISSHPIGAAVSDWHTSTVIPTRRSPTNSTAL